MPIRRSIPPWCPPSRISLVDNGEDQEKLFQDYLVFGYTPWGAVSRQSRVRSHKLMAITCEALWLVAISQPASPHSIFVGS